MRANKILLVTLCLFVISGCAGLVSKTPSKVVLLPDERIYTIPANQEISMMIDGKPITMAFPTDMKVVSSTVLVRQEQRLNEEALKGAKAKDETTKKLTLWGSIFSALAFGLGIFFKAKSWLPKISFQGSVK